MPEEQHIIIKPVHTLIISCAFIIMVVGAAVFMTSLRKDVDTLQMKVDEQKVAIKSLTKSMNCYIAGGGIECLSNNSLSLR